MTKMKFINFFMALGLLLTPVSPVLAMEAPTLDVLVPENGEAWDVGSTHQITWDNGGYVLVDIAYTLTGSDNGPWIQIATDVDANSSYTWLVPNTPTATALIRLYGHFPGGNGPEGYEYGDGTFQIVNPIPVQALTVISPNGGEIWKMGSWQLVRWTSHGLARQEKIRIEINRSGLRWQTLGYMPNIGIFPWRVTGPKTNTALIRVVLVRDISINDSSDRFFRITNK